MQFVSAAPDARPIHAGGDAETSINQSTRLSSMRASRAEIAPTNA
jgi:hypothetical protein